jgi:hypothetical protein
LAWGLQHNKAATAVIKKSEERAMSIQKKSLINSRTATQKAIIASTRLVAPVVSNKLVAASRAVFASKAAPKMMASKSASKVAAKAAGKAGK